MRSGDPLSPDSRALPIRRLTDEEAESLGFAGPLQLSRVQFGRLGWWRNSRWYVVETVRREHRMTVTARELARYGVTTAAAAPTRSDRRR